MEEIRGDAHDMEAKRMVNSLKLGSRSVIGKHKQVDRSGAAALQLAELRGRCLKLDGIRR